MNKKGNMYFWLIVTIVLVTFLIIWLKGIYQTKFHPMKECDEICNTKHGTLIYSCDGVKYEYHELTGEYYNIPIYKCN